MSNHFSHRLGQNTGSFLSSSDLAESFDHFGQLSQLCLPLSSQLVHQLANGNRKVTDDGLTETGKHLIVNLTRESGAEKLVDWQGHKEFHHGVDCGIWAGSFGVGLEVLEVGTDGRRH